MLSGRFNERLYSLIDRLVVDSSEWDDLSGQFLLIDRAMKESGLVVQDLAWTRIYYYRLAVAGLFDEPVAIAALESVKSLKVVINPKHRASGLQLVAWVAVQAGWRLGRDLVVGDSKNSFQFEKSSGDLVDVSLIEKVDSAPLSLLEMNAGEVNIYISRDIGANLLRQVLKVNGRAVVDRHTPADHDDSGELVAEQLSRGGKNSLFAKVLPQFIQLLGQ